MTKVRNDNVKSMDERRQLEQIISDYDNVVAHYDDYSNASRGAMRPGEERTNIYSKRYSNTQEFIAWRGRIRVFLRYSSVSNTDEAKEIIELLESFRGFGEEEKLGALSFMLKALHDNWNLLSQKNEVIAERRQTILIPKFEFKCNGGDGSTKKFFVKNVSSAIASSITVENFVLLCVDGCNHNLIIDDIGMPTSLGPNETGEFNCNHRFFAHRGVGYKEFRLIFTAKDEYSNSFRYIATKNVDNQYDKRYMIGQWDIRVECVHSHNTTIEEGRTIVYNNVNIGGNAQNVQIQQDSDNSSQVQNTNIEFDFDAAQKVLDEIMKYQPMFGEEFGEKSQEIVDAISDAQNAIAEKNQGTLINAWNWLKNVAANATGGIIAAGISALLDKVHI